MDMEPALLWTDRHPACRTFLSGSCVLAQISLPNGALIVRRDELEEYNPSKDYTMYHSCPDRQRANKSNLSAMAWVE